MGHQVQKRTGGVRAGAVLAALLACAAVIGLAQPLIVRAPITSDGSGSGSGGGGQGAASFSIEPITAQTVPLGAGQLQIGLTFTGVTETDAASLTITGMSSDPAVVANDGTGIVATGAGLTDRIVTITVIAASEGAQTTITLSASVQGETATQTFAVTVGDGGEAGFTAAPGWTIPWEPAPTTVSGGGAIPFEPAPSTVSMGSSGIPFGDYP